MTSRYLISTINLIGSQLILRSNIRAILIDISWDVQLVSKKYFLFSKKLLITRAAGT